MTTEPPGPLWTAALACGALAGPENPRSAERGRHDDRNAGKIKVAALIRAVPGYGPTKGDADMREVGIDEAGPVSGLGPRQREQLLAALG